MAAIPELTEPLGDGVVRVRLAAERDIPEVLIAYQDDPRMHERLGLTRAPSGAELGRQAERAEVDRQTGRCVRLTILYEGGDDCAGRIAVHHIDWLEARAEVGIWVAPALRNRGLARGALRLASDWLLGTCGLERLALLTEPENEPMIRACHAAGFAEEGILRSYASRRSGRVDMAIFSLVRGDLER